MKTLREDLVSKGSNFEDFVRFHPHTYTRTQQSLSSLWAVIIFFHQQTATFNSFLTNAIMQRLTWISAKFFSDLKDRPNAFFAKLRFLPNAFLTEAKLYPVNRSSSLKGQSLIDTLILWYTEESTCRKWSAPTRQNKIKRTFASHIL